MSGGSSTTFILLICSTKKPHEVVYLSQTEQICDRKHEISIMLLQSTMFHTLKSPNHVLTLLNTIHGRQSNETLNNRTTNEGSACNW